MASRHRVTCTNKRSTTFAPHEQISHIGGVNDDDSRWKLPEDAAIEVIEDEKYQFYVLVNGKQVDVVIDKHNGRKYLKTKADNYSPDNLLNLHECL